jgi:low affinity Fe/Cu permease
MAKIKGFPQWIEAIATKSVAIAGSTTTLVISILLVSIWAISGIFMHFSPRWEGIIATASSVITFLMVFMIQKSQNKHSLSIQLKLNELVAANDRASNRLVNVEGMTQDELKVIEKYYSKLGDFTKREENLQQSHSIDEVHDQHSIKQEMEQELTEVKKTTEK